MPYRRRGFRRRNRGGISKWRRYGAKAGGLAYKAYQGVKYIKSLINVEKKKVYNGNTWTATPVATAAVAANLSSIAQGDNYNQRQGDSVLAQSLLFRAQMTRNSLNTALNNWVRVMIVIDTQFRSSDPTLDTIISDTSTDYSIITPLDPYINGRFRVLYDKVFTLTSDKPGATIEYFKNFGKKFHIKYQGTDSTDSSLNKNQILMYHWTSSTSNSPTFVWTSKLSYTDN